MKLTETKIKAIAKGGRYSESGTPGLILRVSGKRLMKYWIHRLVVHGRQREIGLGPWPEISLEEARFKVIENRRARLAGIDPLEAKRRAAKVPTFRQAAQMLADSKTWKDAVKGKTVWLARLDNHAAALSNVPVDKVDPMAVLNVLTRLWTAKPELARKLRQQINSVLALAVAHGFIRTNPAASLDGALPRAKAGGGTHHKALPHGEVAEALAVLDASSFTRSLALLLRFQVLTATRPSEARLATWGEIEGRVWTIPSRRTKTSKPHRVPLSDEAMEVLAEARTLGPWTADSPIFPSALKPGKPLSDRAMLDALKSLGIDSSVHGFRSSFRDWAAENGKDRATAEAALAHVVGGVEGAYFRSDLFERRRTLMQEWADYLNRVQGAAVVNG